MKIFDRNRRKKGYSLAELLTVVAIVGILCAITVVGVSGYYKHLKQLEMDQTAKEMYIAAQNHLTYAEVNGELAELDTTTLGEQLPSKPYDMDDEDWNEGDYYYIVYSPANKAVLDNTILKEMLPMGAIDGVAREAGSYIIEYNVKNASVYAVFYTEKGQENELTATDETGRFLPGDGYRGSPKDRMKAQKKSGKKFPLGYYGGSAVSGAPVEKIDTPTVEVLNGDKLIVKVTDTNKIKTNISLEVTGETSHAKKIIPLNEKNAKKEHGQKVYTVILDDITTKDKHFAQIFAETATGKKDGFTPGEDITITVKAVGKEVLTPIVKTKPVTTNSLFHSVTTKTDEDGNTIIMANVSSIRHLENLDPAISGMAEDAITDASQLASTQYEFAEKMGIDVTSFTKDEQLDYRIFEAVAKESGSSFTIYKADGTPAAKDSYYSITNSHLTSYNGNKFQIKNLQIKDQANAGMFGELVATSNKDRTLTISNLQLIDADISAKNTSKQSGVAGGFVGSLTSERNATLTSDVIINHCAIKNLTIKGSQTGGFIGAVNSDTNSAITHKVKIKGCSIDQLDMKATKTAGGIMAQLNSYNNSSITNNITIEDTKIIAKSGKVKIEAPQVGGLIGFINDDRNSSIDSDISIKKSSVKGDDIIISANNTKIPAAAGLVGIVSGKNNLTIEDSFVEGKNMTVTATGTHPVAAGLVGSVSGGKLTVKNSYSTSLVTIEAKQSESSGIESFAGGLIGQITQTNQDSLIENCYVAGRTINGGKYDETASNITANVTNGKTTNIGGLIGTVNSPQVVAINNCYTTAWVSATGNGQKNIGGLIGQATNIQVDNSYATGLVKANKSNDNVGTFIGKVDQNVSSLNKNNYVLSGINSSDIQIVGNDKDSTIATKASTDTIGAKKTYTAHPYDEDLKDPGQQTGTFPLRPVIDDTHYGDWPKASNQITKAIINHSQQKITQSSLANQGMSFVLTNTTKHKKYTFNYDSFSENRDGTYSGAFSLPEDEFDLTDQFTMNELKSKVDGTYNGKFFTLYSADKEITKSKTNSEKGYIGFKLTNGDDLEFKVKNEYFNLIQVKFQYFDQMTNSVTQIETKKFKSNDTVEFSTLIDASVNVPDGKAFNGVWLLTDKDGHPKESQVRINQLGELVDQSGNPTGGTYQLQDSETEVYFTAEFIDVPVITLQYGIMTNGRFTSIIGDQSYQVNKGNDFDVTIDIKNILNDTYIFKSVSENGASVNVNRTDKRLKFNIQNIQENHTYQVVIDGKSTKYQIKYLFLNSQGSSIDNLTYDANAPIIEVENVQYHGTVIDSGKELDGVVDMFTNVSLDNLGETPQGFSEPTWTNIKIKDNQDNIVYVIYAREKYDANYNLDGGKSQEGNYWIPRKEYEFASYVTLQEAPTKLGYDFQGWQVTDSQNNPVTITNQQFTMPNSDVTITALWREKELADYTIEFYLEKVSDKPDLADQDKSYDYYKSVTINQKKVGQVPNLHQDYADFNKVASIFGEKYQQYYSYNQINTANALTNTIVKADGSTIIKVYFDRKVITINFMYENEEEARQAAKDYGGDSAEVEASYRFVSRSKPKAEREYMGWFYWVKPRYIKITEDTVLPDDEPVYFRYHWGTETYVETTFKHYKSHVWKWDKTDGNWGMWRFGYYEKTDKQSNVVYKGLYGAPFIQEGSNYYQFGWNHNKNWIAHFGSILNISAEELNYYDSFTLPKEEGKVLMLHANPKSGDYYKVVHYIQNLDPITEWGSKFVMSSGKDFKYTFVDQFQGFTVEGYNATDKFAGTVISPFISSIPSSKQYEVGDSSNNLLNVFHRRNKYELSFKNVNNISNESVYYQSTISSYLKQDLDQRYIPTNIDSDYLFDGWYDSMSEDANPVDINMRMPAHSYIAFAHWKAPTYSVTLHYKENPETSEWITSNLSVDKYQTSKDNSKFAHALNESQTVTNQDYQFKQWYYDENFEQIYNEGDPIIADTQLYAKYTQTGGTKTVKVHYVCGSDAQGNIQYFQVDQDGHVQYEADGKTPKITNDSSSYYTISGEFGTITNIIPQVVSGYKPQSSYIAIKFDEKTNDINIQYSSVETWDYTITYMLKKDWKNIELASFNKDTYYNQIVEYAPQIAGFKLVDGETGFAMMNQQDKKHQHNFYYQIDPDYEFETSGDYDFASNNYGIANYDGSAHEISLKAQEFGELPNNVVVTIHYFNDTSQVELSSAPIEVGQYYALINVTIENVTIFSSQVELEIQ